MKSPIGFEYNNSLVEELPYFLYELSIYKISKYNSVSLKQKYYKTNNILNIPECKVIKRYNNFKIVAFVTLLGVTKEFIEQNNLKIYEKGKNRNPKGLICKRKR